MSTELADITEVEYRQLLLERVVLVSVWTAGSEVSAENSMAELKLLAETAGSQVLEGLIQRRHGHLRRRADSRAAAQSRGPRRRKGD
jgi:GTP-binding protein HflX